MGSVNCVLSNPRILNPTGDGTINDGVYLNQDGHRYALAGTRRSPRRL